MSAKPQKSRAMVEKGSQTSERKDEQVKDVPFDNWTPKYRKLARVAYLEYAEDLAEGAGALHTLELALIKACRALPAIYQMVIPAALGTIATCHVSVIYTEKAEMALMPVLSQIPLLLQKVREAGGFTKEVLKSHVDDDGYGPGMVAFVKGKTRLPQILALEERWEEEVFNATDR